MRRREPPVSGFARAHAWLLGKTPRLTGMESSDRGSLLAPLLLFMIGWALFMILVLRFVVAPESGWGNPELPLAGVVVVLFVLAYLLNRRGYYLSAASLLVFALLAGVFVGTYLSLSGLMEPYYGRADVGILSFLLLSVHGITPEGRFLCVNDAACASLGGMRDEPLLMTVAEVDLNCPFDALQAHWSKLKHLDGLPQTMRIANGPLRVRKDRNCAERCVWAS